MPAISIMKKSITEIVRMTNWELKKEIIYKIKNLKIKYYNL